MNKALEALETIKYECGFAFGQTANGDRVRASFPIIEKELKKLALFKDIEDMLGCPLEIVFRALKNGFYDHSGKFIECPELSGTSEAGWIIGNALSDYQFFKLSDYGKKTVGGWVLTKEELNK